MTVFFHIFFLSLEFYILAGVSSICEMIPGDFVIYIFIDWPGMLPAPSRYRSYKTYE